MRHDIQIPKNRLASVQKAYLDAAKMVDAGWERNGGRVSGGHPCACPSIYLPASTAMFSAHDLREQFARMFKPTYMSQGQAWFGANTPGDLRVKDKQAVLDRNKQRRVLALLFMAEMAGEWVE
jgi:hypothetical protein